MAPSSFNEASLANRDFKRFNSRGSGKVSEATRQMGSVQIDESIKSYGGRKARRRSRRSHHKTGSQIVVGSRMAYELTGKLSPYEMIVGDDDSPSTFTWGPPSKKLPQPESESDITMEATNSHDPRAKTSNYRSRSRRESKASMTSASSEESNATRGTTESEVSESSEPCSIPNRSTGSRKRIRDDAWTLRSKPYTGTRKMPVRPEHYISNIGRLNDTTETFPLTSDLPSHFSWPRQTYTLNYTNFVNFCTFPANDSPNGLGHYNHLVLSPVNYQKYLDHRKGFQFAGSRVTIWNRFDQITLDMTLESSAAHILKTLFYCQYIVRASKVGVRRFSFKVDLKGFNGKEGSYSDEKSLAEIFGCLKRATLPDYDKQDVEEDVKTVEFVWDAKHDEYLDPAGFEYEY